MELYSYSLLFPQARAGHGGMDKCKSAHRGLGATSGPIFEGKFIDIEIRVVVL